MAKLVAFEIMVNGVRQTVTDVKQLDALLDGLIKHQRYLTEGTKLYADNVKAVDKLIQAKNRLLAAETKEQEAASRSAKKRVEDTNFEANSVLDLKAKLALLSDEYVRMGNAQKTAAGKTLASEIKATSAAIIAQTKALQVHRTSIHDYRAALNSLSTSLFSAFSGDQAGILKAGSGEFFNSIASITTGNIPVGLLQLASSFANLAGEAVKFNAEISDAEADVAKNANLSLEQVQKLAEQLSTLDTRTTLEGLLKIGDSLGKLGVEVTPQVIAVMDKLNVALSDEFGNNPEKIATVVGKLKTLFKEFDSAKPEQAYLNIGNALNSLAATGAATAPVIAEFSTRIAGTSGIYGLAASEILGVSATLEELGTTAYRGAGGFGRFIKQITSDTENFATTLKLTPEIVQQFTGSFISFSDLVNKDVGAAYRTVLGRIKELNLSNTDLAAVYKQLHIVGSGEIEVVSKLSQSYDLLTKRLGDASKAISSTTSVENEFSKKNQNLAGEISKLGNSLQEVFLSGALANGLSHFLSRINEYFNGTKTLLKSLEDEQIKINTLGEAIFDLNSKTGNLNETRKEQIEKINSLKTVYPEYFGQISTESAETSLLLEKILKVNTNRDSQNALIAKFKLEHPAYITALKDDTSESAKLVRELLDVNTTNERRNELITQLRTNYPQFFAKLQQELDLTHQLKSALDGVNEAYGLKRQFARTQQLAEGNLPNQVKDLRALVDEQRAFYKYYINAVTVKNPTLGLTTSQSADERAKLLYNLTGRQKSTLVGVTASESNEFKSIVENYSKNVEQLKTLETKLKNVRDKISEEIETDFKDKLLRAEDIQKVLTNSILEFNEKEKLLEKTKKSGDFTAQDEATKRLKKLGENVKELLQEIDNSGFSIIENPTGRIKAVLDGVKSAANEIKSIQDRIEASTKNVNSTNGKEVSILPSKVKAPKATPTRPSDNPFLNAFETARKQEEDYYRKQKDLTDKLDRETDESRAKSISLSRKREKEIAEKVLKDKIAEVEQTVQKLELEQIQADEKYGEAIKRGQDYLAEIKRKGLPDTEGIAAKVKQLETERAKFSEESSKKIEETFRSSGENVLELYAAFKQKKVEIDEKYDKKMLEDFLLFTSTNTQEALNRINEQFNDALQVSADKRVETLQGILSSNISPRKKKAQLLATDRKADAEEIKLRIDNLQKIYEVELQRLDAFTVSNSFNKVSSSLFPAIPKSEVEKQVKTVENARKQVADAKRRLVEKEVTIARGEFTQEEKSIQRLTQLRTTALDLLSKFAQTQLEIERNNAEAIFNARTEFLEREYAYKQRLFKDDADNLARLEKNKAEEQKKLQLEYAKERQRIAIKEAEINTALSIIKVYATSPDPITATIIAAGELLLLSEQIRAIKSQKFAKGGYTGNFNGRPDETGEVPVGIVHAREYVIPRKVLATSRGKALADEAEALRRGYYPSASSFPRLYAEGGFVGKTPYILPNNISVTIDNAVMTTLADRLYDAVLQGSQSGTYLGAESSNKLKERLKFAAKNSTI